MDNQMTPSQEAKTFAAANGFNIQPNVRRYDVYRNIDGAHVANVGGYPAALNAMKDWIDNAVAGMSLATKFANAVVGDNPADARAKVHGLVRIAGERDDALHARIDEFASARIIKYDGVTYGTLEPITPDTLKVYDILTPGAKWDDASIVPQQSCDYADFNEESIARIRKAARKLSGKPPGGPWHVVCDGQNVTASGYPSRADALAVVRWGFNHPDRAIRNNWRTATVTVEYRAS